MGESPCGFESHPGHIVDPVTGLSKRQATALALLIPLGIVVSTIVTFRSEHGEAVCPEGVAEGCSISEPGEPVVIGVIAEDASIRAELVSATTGRSVLGHSLKADLFATGCDVGRSSEAARDTTDNPPYYPPAALVLVSVCEAAAIGPLQIADDEGIPAVAHGGAAGITTPLENHLEADQPTPAIEELFELFAAALEKVAVEDEGRVLIPLTALREALVAKGFRRA